MSLLDLGAVTRTLIKIIDLSVNASPAWPPLPSPKLQVLSVSPDRLTMDNTAGIYLYHLTEDPQFKNVPPPSGSEELRFRPMALNLYYVLSAHVEDSDSSALKEQLIMGLAAKALRDHPVISDATRINNTPVLDPAIQNADNRLHVYLQPVPPAEAVSYWTAGSSATRLSAYYQVSVVLLDPDEPPMLSGRVLSYGIQTFVSGAPRLEASRSIVTFRLPGETIDRTATARPAQVTQIPPGDPFVLLGTDLAAGPATLLLRPSGVATPIEADETWGLQISNEGASAQAQAAANGNALLPGIYAASIRVTRTFTLPDGSTRTVAQTSNEVPLVIAPGIQALSAPTAAGQFTITGTGFAPPMAVELYIGAAKLVRGNPMALTPAQFAVQGNTQILVGLPAGLPSGAAVPVRVIVSGSESPPAWVSAP